MHITMPANLYLENIRHVRGDRAADIEGSKLIDSIDSYYRKLLAIPKGPARARHAHELIGEAIDFGLKYEMTEQVTCTKGCSECCRMYVVTVPSEAELIMTYIRENNTPVKWDRADVQSGAEEEDYYTQKMKENNKCMFLSDEGVCNIYTVRPAACRLHFVVSPKEMCAMDGPNRVLKAFLCTAEAIQIALLNLEMFGRTALPSAMIELKRKGY